MKRADTTTSIKINYYSDMGLYEFATTAELLHSEQQEKAQAGSVAGSKKKRKAHVPLKRLYEQTERPLRTLLALFDKSKAERKM